MVKCCLIYLGYYGTEMVGNYGTENFPYRILTYGIFMRCEITVRYIFKGTEYENIPYRSIPLILG